MRFRNRQVYMYTDLKWSSQYQNGLEMPKLTANWPGHTLRGPKGPKVAKTGLSRVIWTNQGPVCMTVFMVSCQLFAVWLFSDFKWFAPSFCWIFCDWRCINGWWSVWCIINGEIEMWDPQAPSKSFKFPLVSPLAEMSVTRKGENQRSAQLGQQLIVR